MKCNLVAEHLSLYIDQELGTVTCQYLEDHVLQCDACRAKISEYRAMGSLMRRSEQRVETAVVWNRVSGILESPAAKPASRQLQWRRWTKRHSVTFFVAAAAIVLLFSALQNVIRDNHDISVSLHSHVSLAEDFAEVFRSARAEPQQALAKLSSKYEGQELSVRDTTQYLGYEPVLFESTPDGFTRVSTHVLNMPCCKCSATICERSDGTSLIVFEHMDEQPIWFGDLPSIDTQCSGMPCKIVESAGQLAVSWRIQDRQMTIVGAEDLAEVNQWVASLKM